MNEVNNIFIVDDDPVQAMMLSDHLGKYSYLNVHTYLTGEECMKNIGTLKPQIVFLDYYFDKVSNTSMNGLDILKAIRGEHPDIDVVMFSGQDKIEVAVNTMKYGAFDYIVKSESAFHRAENVIFNIIRKLKLEQSAALYKRLTLIFGITLGLLIIVTIILYFMGLIAVNPGWA
ncbi:MAG TPA: response regulator [Bacteroidia bacterium]|nr:response regulator [Bacteroidia bacterium]